MLNMLNSPTFFKFSTRSTDDFVLLFTFFERIYLRTISLKFVNDISNILKHVFDNEYLKNIGL